MIRRVMLMRQVFFACAFLNLLAWLFLAAACRSDVPGTGAPQPAGDQSSADRTPESGGQADDHSSGVTATLPSTDVDRSDGDSLPLSFDQTMVSLGSYQLMVEVLFEGQDAAGLPLSFSASGLETVVHEPSFRRIDLSGEGSGGSGSQSLSFIRQGDVTYLYVPEIGCVSGSGAEFDSEMRLPLDPSGLLEGSSALSAASSSVMLDGREYSEYRFDEAALSWAWSGQWAVDGSILVDVITGYVSNVDLAISGKGDILGDGRILDGHYDVAIDLAEFSNQELGTLPEACSGSTLYPVTPDAYEVTTIDNLLSFKSALPLGDVVDFYLNAMPASGWQLSSEPDVFDDLAILNFERNGTPLMISVEFDGGSGAVGVLISP